MVHTLPVLVTKVENDDGRRGVPEKGTSNVLIVGKVFCSTVPEHDFVDAVIIDQTVGSEMVAFCGRVEVQELACRKIVDEGRLPRTRIPQNQYFEFNRPIHCDNGN